LFTFEKTMLKFRFSRNILRKYSSAVPTIRDVLSKKEINSEVKVRGWIKTTRAMKENIFADLNDGSSGEVLQIICSKSDKSKLGFGSSVEATGTLSVAPKGQLELKVKDLKLLGDCPLEGFPYVARQSYSPEYIRENLHLRSRVSSFNSMVRCRHSLTNIINNYLHREGFLQIHTPVLTGEVDFLL
jgi:asparaginyl-tRNA synthetase